MPLAFEKRQAKWRSIAMMATCCSRRLSLAFGGVPPIQRVRRHIRGAWFSGKPDAVEGDYLEDFVKNAAR
jgi:hypothetical protein